MATTQRAARFYGKEDIRIESNVPRPSMRPGQVRVQPAFVGICGTDLHEYLGGPNFSPTSPHPITGEEIPIGVGHEFSGTILELGPDTASSNLSVGQAVAVQPTIYCGACSACAVGAENACPSGGFIGLSGGGGGLAEEVLAPADQCVPLSPRIPLDVGALVEPLAVAWHAVDAAGLDGAALRAASCVVFGGGPIGLAVLQVLRARGVARCVCVEVAARRQQFARDLGADEVVDPSKTEDVPARLRELCGDAAGGDGGGAEGNSGGGPAAGPDVVFDCAGVPASLEAACTAVRARGVVVNVAIWERPVPFNPNWLVFREATYRAVLGYQKKDFQGVVRALEEGALRPAGMITGRIGMNELVEKGYKALIYEKDKHVKILVDVRASLQGE